MFRHFLPWKPDYVTREVVQDKMFTVYKAMKGVQDEHYRSTEFSWSWRDDGSLPN